MIVDSLRKALLVIKYKQFLGMIRIKNKKELLAFIKLEDDLKDAYEKRQANYSKTFEFRTNAS